MPIAPLAKKGNRREKIQELIDWINKMEGNLLVQSAAGSTQFPNKMDLSGFLTKDEARGVGLPIP